MPRSTRPAATHALRLDPSAIVQSGVAFLLAYLIAFVFNAI